jgi:rhodanese-related sulfurtransferase
MSLQTYAHRQTGTLLRRLLLIAGLLGTGPAMAESPPAIDGVASVSAEQLIELAGRTPGLVILDARLGKDRKLGYIEGSISLPDVDTNCQTLARVLPRRETPTVYYCNGPKCGRSANAIRTALACGYTNIHWFRGGLEEWLAKGYPHLRE